MRMQLLIHEDGSTSWRAGRAPLAVAAGLLWWATLQVVRYCLYAAAACFGVLALLWAHAAGSEIHSWREAHAVAHEWLGLVPLLAACAAAPRLLMAVPNGDDPCSRMGELVYLLRLADTHARRLAPEERPAANDLACRVAAGISLAATVGTGLALALTGPLGVSLGAIAGLLLGAATIYVSGLRGTRASMFDVPPLP